MCMWCPLNGSCRDGVSSHLPVPGHHHGCCKEYRSDSWVWKKNDWSRRQIKESHLLPAPPVAPGSCTPQPEALTQTGERKESSDRPLFTLLLSQSPASVSSGGITRRRRRWDLVGRRRRRACRARGASPARSRRRGRIAGREGRQWRATGGRRRGSVCRGRAAPPRSPPRTRSTSRGGGQSRRRWGWGGTAAPRGRRARGRWRRPGCRARSSRGRGPWGRPRLQGPPRRPRGRRRRRGWARSWSRYRPWSPIPSARTRCRRTRHSAAAASADSHVSRVLCDLLLKRARWKGGTSLVSVYSPVRRRPRPWGGRGDRGTGWWRRWSGGEPSPLLSPSPSPSPSFGSAQNPNERKKLGQLHDPFPITKKRPLFSSFLVERSWQHYQMPRWLSPDSPALWRTWLVWIDDVRMQEPRGLSRQLNQLITFWDSPASEDGQPRALWEGGARSKKKKTSSS